MQIYIDKNGQQIGPFTENVILNMLRTGELSPNDSAIRQGQRYWQPLGVMFPSGFQTPAPVLSAPPVNKPRMKKQLVGGFYVGSLVLMIFGLLSAAILALVGADSEIPGFFAGGAAVAIFAYLQFLIVHVVVMFYVLFKMWDAIQDGISTSTGKAIGFLFIPLFSIYWIFKAWGGYPDEYNNFIVRHQLGVSPLRSSAFVMFPLFALLGGLLVLPVVVIPFIFISVISQTSDAVNRLFAGLENKRSGGFLTAENPNEPLLSPLMRFSVFGLAGISLIAILGLAGIGWWNKNPTPSADDLPETIGQLSKTRELLRKGSFLGLRKQFGALYESADKKKAIVYDIRSALNNYEKQVYVYGNAKKGTVTDQSGNKIGEFAFRDGSLEIYNGNKKILIWDLNRSTPSYILPVDLKKEGKITSMSESEMLELAKSLPINAQLKFSEAAPSTNPTTTNNTKTTTTTTPSSNSDLKGGREISPTEKADFTMTSEEFLLLSKKSDTTQYLGKVFDLTGRAYILTGSTRLKANIYDYVDINLSSTQPAPNLKEDEMLKVKCVGVQKYSRLEPGNCLIIENKGIVSTDGSPDFTMTADEYDKGTQNVVNKYRNKVIDVTGKVKLIGNKGEYLVTSKSWLWCRPLAGKESDFQNLTDGAQVKFRGLGDVGGLKHCIVVSR